MEFSEETNVNSGSVDRRNNNELNKEHPWLYLVKMFRFESMEAKTYKFTCLLCRRSTVSDDEVLMQYLQNRSDDMNIIA